MSGSPPPPPPPPPSPVTALSLAAQHLVYDASRKLIYASISNADSTHPNTIAIIDPSTSSVTGAIPVGTNPNRLALSQDAKYLYVGADGDGTVQRVDLPSRTVVLTIPLGANLSAGSIAVMPGASTTIAVDIRVFATSPPYGGITIFDGATPRTNTLDSIKGSADQIAFSDDGATLYGAQISDSSFAFHRFAVDANGITAGSSFPLIFGGYGDGMVYASGKIYTWGGFVFDPATMTPLGTFPLTRGVPPLIDVAGGSAYYPTPDTTQPPVLQQFSLSTYLKTGSLSVSSSGVAYYFDLVKTGSTGYAFIGGSVGTSSPSIILTTQTITPVAATTPTLSNVLVNHIVYDSARQKIYASLPSSNGSNGNSIAVINPANSTIETFIPVGSEPNLLALSSDASYLYVGLDGAASISRINLSTQTVDLTFAIGQDPGLGFAKAISIAAMPGSPQTIAVATREIANWSAVYYDYIFDDGVPRPNAPACQASNVLTFGSSGGLYGFYLGVFEEFQVDSGGLTCLSVSPGLIAGSAGQLAVDGSYVYISNGFAIDPAKPSRAGIFAIGANRGFAIDDTANEIYFLADDRAPNKGYSAIFAFDKNTLVYKGKMQITAKWGQGFDLTECGASCFAYAVSPGITITSGTITAASPPPLPSLPVYHLLYDPGRNLIYASVSGGIPSIGNSVVIIDPTSQTIQSSAYVGSEPDAMAISADGSALYVGLDGPASIVKVDLPSMNVGSPVAVGTYPTAYGSSPLLAQYIAVSPADPNVIAVSRDNSTIAIWNNGVQLPNVTNYPFVTVNSIAFGDATHLYGYNNRTTGYDFYRMTVDNTGVTIADDQDRLVYGFNANITFDAGLVYSTNGAIVDPVLDTIGGTFAGTSNASGVAFDDAENRAYFVAYDVPSQRSSILAYDKTSSAFIGSQQISRLQSYGYGSPLQSFDLIKHNTGLTYATADGQIIFANPAFPAPTDLPLGQLPANHLVYDSVRQVIYASIPGRGGLRANSIAIINPATATITGSIPIGSEPGVMALSSDDNYLYVGLQGAAMVKRINLATQLVDEQFALGADSFFGPQFAQSLSVMPGNSGVVAVAKMYPTIIPPAAGVGIFSSGAQLPNSLTSRYQSNSLAFSSSPGTLYGFENDQTSFNFNRMAVDANGVTLTDATGGLISGGATIQYDGGLIYATTGTVVDPAIPSVVNIFSGVGVGVADAMAIDNTLGRVYFLMYDSTAKTVNILAYDKSSYQQTGSMTVSAATARGTDIVRWGQKGLAVSTANEIVLISNAP